jgi:glycoside/pentoside/hexuronide:cation symporter, GPH family
VTAVDVYGPNVMGYKTFYPRAGHQANLSRLLIGTLPALRIAMEPHHQTASKDRIPLSQKIAFGLGASTPIAFVNTVSGLTNLIYNVGLGVNPVLLGIAQMVPRAVDAIFDPWFGSISDNTRTRWGRRRPYILVGGMLTGLLYVALWLAPRGWGQNALLEYYLTFSLLFFLASSIFTVPHGALGLEMSGDYHERTRLFAVASFIGNISAMATPWIYTFANSKLFPDEVEGMKYAGVAVGCIIIVTSIWCATVCRERKFQQASHQEKRQFWSSMKLTLQNRIFMRLILIVGLVTIGFSFVNGFSNYIMIYYVFDGAKRNASVVLGWLGMVWAVSALLTVFPMSWCSSRLGKLRTMQIFLFLMIVGSLLKIVCYSPQYPWLAIFPTVLISAGMLGVYTMASSMTADVCDEDELRTGTRREGIYSAVYGWWLKLAISTAFLIAGFLLQTTHFDEKVQHQLASTCFWLRFWEIGIPSVLCSMSLGLLYRYPLTEERAYQFKALLESANKIASKNS